MSVALGASASASAVVLSHKVALVLTIVMLAFSTGSFAYNAQQRRGYGPLLLCLFAAPLLLSNPVINLLEVRLPPRASPRPCARCTRACCLLLPAHLTRRHPDLAALLSPGFRHDPELRPDECVHEYHHMDRGAPDHGGIDLECQL
jgi:hypothetical protein